MGKSILCFKPGKSYTMHTVQPVDELSLVWHIRSPLNHWDCNLFGVFRDLSFALAV